MANKVMQMLIKAFGGAVDLIERLISGIPGAETAIIWGVFVTLVTGFLIIPIRGIGQSDRARAGRALRQKSAIRRSHKVISEDQKSL